MNLKHVLIGKPFPTSRSSHERLDKLRGLAVFASDPISSNAYATEAIMSVLVVISVAALQWTVPIAMAIALLVGLVIISYNQTITHYPGGGGAYLVAKDNLGTTPSLFAAAALLSDYVLTVAVSVSAGVRALTSAFPEIPSFHDNRVLLGICIIAIITWLNLRGVRESGTIFALPTYAFVAGVLCLLALSAMRSLGIVGMPPLPPPEIPVTQASDQAHSSMLIVWLVLRAFAAGCTALTGIEALADGVPAFRDPAPRNARLTMRAMGLIAMTLFLGISFFATRLGIMPDERESVLSQLTRAAAGTGPLYYWVQTFTMLILVLAANTAYQDFPRLAAIIARDGFLPRWMTRIGSRLVYSAGIIVLAGLASLLLAAFGGNEINLLPLYAIGVFTSFTLSQSGMLRLWNRVARLQPDEELNTGLTTLHYERNVAMKRLPSAIGAVATGLVLTILIVTKFFEGAWLILLAIGLIVLLFRGIKRHYATVAANLRISDLQAHQLRDPAEVVIVPVGDLHRGSLRALKYALRMSRDVRAVKVVSSLEEEVALRQRWVAWHPVIGQAQLICLTTDYRDIVTPLVTYIRQIHDRECPNQLLTVVLPEFVPESPLAHLLHNQTAIMLRALLRTIEDVVVIDVPYHLRRETTAASKEA